MDATIDTFVIGNMVWNAGLIGVTGFFIKKWVVAREVRETEIRTEALAATTKTAVDLAVRQEKSCEDIKGEIGSNRNYYEKTYKDLKQDIKEIAGLQRVANGRVGKVELDLAVLSQKHEDRINMRQRSTDHCTNGGC